MTLYAENPPGPRSVSENPDLSPLVLGRNKPPRVPLWYRLRYPWRTRWITLLIREADRWQGTPNTRPEALTFAEKALFERAQQARQAAITDVVKRIDGLADRYQSQRADAARERKLAEIERRRRLLPPLSVQAYVAGPVSPKQAENVIGECRHKIAEDTALGDTRHLDRPSKRRDVLTASPLVADILALLAVIAKFLNVTPENALGKLPETAAAVGFSLIGALVLALLAHSTGDAAWHLRSVSGRPAGDAPEERDQEFPRPKNILYVKAAGLFAVSSVTAVSITTRIIHPTSNVSTGPVGVMIGVLLGVAAFIAPWLIVSNRMRSGSLEVRTIDALTKLMRETEAVVSGHEKVAADAEVRAEKLRQSAGRARIGELDAAMAMAETAKQAVDLARSHHRQAGRYAIDENLPAASPFVSLRSVLAIDTSAIDEAMRRFDIPVEIDQVDPADDEDEEPQ